MEDQAKVEAKIAELQVTQGGSWVAAHNTEIEVNVSTHEVDDLKVFICVQTGAVQTYPHEEFV